MFTEFFKFVGVTDNGDVKTAEDFIRAYGGQSFMNGLYRIFKETDVAKWTGILREAYPEYKGTITAFGFDWLGRVFAAEKERNVVLLFEPGTGELLNLQVDFTEFHNGEIPESHDACLASEFFNEWFEANDRFILTYNKCVGYKVPLFLNGQDEIENLEVSDMEVYWGIMAQLM